TGRRGGHVAGLPLDGAAPVGRPDSAQPLRERPGADADRLSEQPGGPTRGSVMEDLPGYPMARACPYQPPPGYRELPDEPVTRVRLFDGRPAWLVTGHAEACAVLADQRLSVDRARADFPALAPGYTGKPRFRMFAGMDDPDHMQHRRMVLPQFTV